MEASITLLKCSFRSNSFKFRTKFVPIRTNFVPGTSYQVPGTIRYNPEKCASAAGNSKSPNLTQHGREMDRHPSVLRIPGAMSRSGAARSSWDRSRGSELNFFKTFLDKNRLVAENLFLSEEKKEIRTCHGPGFGSIPDGSF